MGGGGKRDEGTRVPKNVTRNGATEDGLPRKWSRHDDPEDDLGPSKQEMREYYKGLSNPKVKNKHAKGEHSHSDTF
jgi:hypothetical protein